MCYRFHQQSSQLAHYHRRRSKPHPLDKNEVNILWNTPSNTRLQTDTNTYTKLNITQSTLMFTTMNNSYAGDYFCTTYVDGFAAKSTVGTLSLNCMFCMYLTLRINNLQLLKMLLLNSQ